MNGRAGRVTAALILTAIVAVAAWLRLSGLAWGLPHAYHPDEGSILLHALGFGTGDLNPHWFRWPSLLMYLMFGSYGAYFLAGKLGGMFSAPADLMRQYLTDPTPFWLLGRATSAAFGVATVWVTHRFTRRAFGEPAALAAAAFLAVMFLHVRDSHYATPDVATAFLASVSLLLAVRAWTRPSAGDLVLSGLFAGLAASAKYPGAIAAIGTFAAGVALASGRSGPGDGSAARPAAGSRFWGLPAALVAIAVGFVAGTPFSVLSPAEFSRDVLMQFNMVSRTGVAQEAGSFLTGLREVFVESLARGVSWPVLALAAIGALMPVALHGRRSERRAGGHGALAGKTIANAYAAAVIGAAVLITVKRSTYLTPALPAVAALAGYGLAALLRWAPKWALGVAAAVVAIYAAVPSVAFNAALARPDTRDLARVWIEKNVPPGSRIAVEGYGPVLNPTEAQLRTLLTSDVTSVGSWQGTKSRVNEERLAIGAARTPQYEVYAIDWWEEPFRLESPDTSAAELAASIERLRVRYVVLSSKAASSRAVEGAEPPDVVREDPFVEWLGSRATRVARFAEERPTPWIDRGPGRSFHNPVIEVYEIGAGGP